MAPRIGAFENAAYHCEASIYWSPIGRRAGSIDPRGLNAGSAWVDVEIRNEDLNRLLLPLPSEPSTLAKSEPVAERAAPSAASRPDSIAETEPAAPAPERAAGRITEPTLTTWYEKYLKTLADGVSPAERRDFDAAKGEYGGTVTQKLVRTVRRAVLSRQGKLNRGRPSLNRVK